MVVDPPPFHSLLTTMNNGGRVKFQKGAEVRIMELNGSVPKGTYTITEEEPTANDWVRSDRRGLVAVLSASGELLKVHHKRVITDASQITAKVFELDSQMQVLCPECMHIERVDSSGNQFTCPQCSITFKTHWIGNTKTMSTEVTEDTGTAVTDAPVAKTARVKKEKVAAAPRTPKEKPAPAVLDLVALAATPNCELWTKGQIKFDHAKTDVKAHVLIFTGENPRKISFNTYNGSLGQKADGLPMTDFLAGTTTKDKAPWFTVDDITKLQAKLTKTGYAKAEV